MIDAPTVLVAGAARRGRAAWTFISMALRLCGARPRRVTPNTTTAPDDADALVLSGGADVDPALFTSEPARAPLDLDRDRDRLEMRLVARAWNARLPMLGICRGAQLLTVFRGGALALHVNDTPRSARPVKDVLVTAGSRLQQVLGRGRVRVNNMHRHVISEPGADLRVAARDHSGRIQAVEAKNQFAIGVQWHPEYLVSRRENLRLFKALTAAAKKHLQRSQR